MRKLIGWVVSISIVISGVFFLVKLYHSSLVESVPVPSIKHFDASQQVVAKELDDQEYLGVHSLNANETAGNEKLTRLWIERKPWLSDYLKRAINDDRHTSRWRSYCVQHFASYIIQTKDLSKLDVLLKAAELDDLQVAEDSIFSIARIMTEIPQDIEKHDVSRIHKLINDNLSITRNARIQSAAIRSIAVARIQGFDERLSRMSQNSQIEISVRISAINAMGELASTGFESKLIALSNSPHLQIRNAANQALKRIHPLESVLPTERQNVASLGDALCSRFPQVRIEAARALLKYGASASSALGNLVLLMRELNGDIEEHDVLVYLKLLQNIGPENMQAADVLCQVLSERSVLYTGRKKDEINRIRSAVLISLTNTKFAHLALSTIADYLSNSDAEMQLNFAAAAYAVSKLEPKTAAIFTPLLLRALQPDFKDRPISMALYNVAGDQMSTSARREALRALRHIGPPAKSALSLLGTAISESSNTYPYWHSDTRQTEISVKGEPK